MTNEREGNMLIYTNESQGIRIDVQFENEDIWLTQRELVALFQTTKSNVSEHIKNIYADGELTTEATVRNFRTVQKEGNREVSRELSYYNLDMIISLGYRINSSIATQFRIWAAGVLKEYLKKGFAMNDDRLKELGGGNYWKELLDRIRDIRSSEKVMYRQVLDLYTQAVDYDSNSELSKSFFKIVQNKLHFAAHGNTAAEVIYFRVDSDKPFAGLTSFKGEQPTQAEAMVAKNYLAVDELRVLNNLVSAYFDLAEISAIEERKMYLADYVNELERILSSTGRGILKDAGKISAKDAKEKATTEYKKYKAKTLDPVEVAYLNNIKDLAKEAKTQSRKMSTGGDSDGK